MTDKKLVNGELVDLTPEDIAQREAEEQEWAIKQEKQKREDQINIIKQKLEELDKKSIRSLREGNTERINKLETEAKALRTELQSLL